MNAIKIYNNVYNIVYVIQSVINFYYIF